MEIQNKKIVEEDSKRKEMIDDLEKSFTRNCEEF